MEHKVTDSEGHRFWLDILGRCGIENECLLNDMCEKDKVEDCRCVIFEGFGEKLLSEALKLFEHTSIHDFSKNVEQDLKPMYPILGKIIFSVFCASEVLP